MTPGNHSRSARRPIPSRVGGIFIIVAVGLAIRASFLPQGFNATDDGWLQSVGLRIAHGQVPYRDFYFLYPPLTAYKEAALISLLGDSYTLIVSRWIFSFEAACCSVLAFLVVCRVATVRAAFLATLATAPFSVQLFYFSNYTYDAIFFALLCILLLITARGRATAMIGSGAAAAMALLAKQPFAALIVVIPIVVLLCPAGDIFGSGLGSRGRAVAAFLLGYSAVVGLASLFFLAQGTGWSFVTQPVLAATAVREATGYAIWQDLPQPQFLHPLLWFGVPMAAACLALGLAPLTSPIRVVLVVLLLGVMAAATLLQFKPSRVLPFYSVSLMLLLALAVAAFLFCLLGGELTAAANRDAQFTLTATAITLQYLTQFSYSGAGLSFIGAYLTVPVAILLLAHASDRVPISLPRTPPMRPGIVVAGAFSVYLALGSYFHLAERAFADSSREALTSSFRTPALAGIRSRPANVRMLDGLVAEAHRYARPGDPILVIPDLPVMYFLAARRNPTSQDWYLDTLVNPSSISLALRQVAGDPPRVVFVQRHTEYDFAHTGTPINYDAIQVGPLYRYILQHYRQVDEIEGVRVFVPT